MVALLRQRHKIQPGALRRHSNAQRRLSLPGRHCMGHRRMGRLGARIAVDLGRSHPGLGQQFVKHQACAAAQGPVDEAGLGARQVSQAVQPQRIARRDHQALGACGKADDLVPPRLQQSLVGALRQ